MCVCTREERGEKEVDGNSEQFVKLLNSLRKPPPLAGRLATSLPMGQNQATHLAAAHLLRMREETSM